MQLQPASAIAQTATTNARATASAGLAEAHSRMALKLRGPLLLIGLQH
jgi:hypothetical protein